ncbi:11770_t:CDS:2 [Diversispora eburnea]|uniref:11770_t:CDS:1 n=1 Tax=Diversispora eburnea TaxID=1213867 RepID=A0A9N8WBT6_9GLOM|nr:11770_t:CDS:2 [Diversispora eburnea]
MDAKAYDALERRRLKTGHNSFDHWYEYYFGDTREEEITRTLCDNAFEALHRKYFNDNDDDISRLRQHKFDEYMNRSHSIGQDMSFPSPVSNSWIEVYKFKNNMDNVNSVNIFPETHEFKDNVNSVNTFPETYEIAQELHELHEEISIDKLSSSQKTITPKEKQTKIIELIDESTIQNEVKGTKRKKLKVCRPRKSSST